MKNVAGLIILVLFTALAVCPAYAYREGDFQIWHTEGQDLTIGKGTKITIEEEFRFGEDASELYYQHYDFGVVYGFDKRLDIGFNYRLIYSKYKKKFREEDRPHINATVKLDLWKFKFEDRNRLEYKHYRYKEDYIRYRNKAALKYPFEWKKVKFVPYLADEIFIASNSTGFSVNRLYSGIELGLTKYVKADIYYLLESAKGTGDKWTDANVLGTKLKVMF